MKRALMVPALMLAVAAGCAHLREPAVWGPIAVLAPLVALDATVTLHVCRVHGCEELNPFNAPFVRSRWLYVVNAAELAFIVAWGDASRHRNKGILRHAWLVSTVANAALVAYAWRQGMAVHREMHQRAAP